MTAVTWLLAFTLAIPVNTCGIHNKDRDGRTNTFGFRLYFRFHQPSCDEGESQAIEGPWIPRQICGHCIVTEEAHGATVRASIPRANLLAWRDLDARGVVSERLVHNDEVRDAFFYCGEHDRKRLGAFTEPSIFLWRALFHVDCDSTKTLRSSSGKLVCGTPNSVNFSYCCLSQFRDRKFGVVIREYPNGCVRHRKVTICPDLTSFFIDAPWLCHQTICTDDEFFGCPEDYHDRTERWSDSTEASYAEDELSDVPMGPHIFITMPQMKCMPQCGT